MRVGFHRFVLKRLQVRGNDSVMASLNATLASGQNEGTISSMLDVLSTHLFLYGRFSLLRSN